MLDEVKDQVEEEGANTSTEVSEIIETVTEETNGGEHADSLEDTIEEMEPEMVADVLESTSDVEEGKQSVL